jgi:hypothetical protein
MSGSRLPELVLELLTAVATRQGSYVAVEYPKSDVIELYGVPAIVYAAKHYSEAQLQEATPESIQLVTTSIAEGQAFALAFTKEFPQIPVLVFNGDDFLRLS